MTLQSPELPNDPDAEQAALGSILLNRDALIALAPVLTASDFYQERHALVYAAMLECYGRRVPPDLRTVASALKDHGHLVLVGGYEYLSTLIDTVPTSMHAEHYGATVARHSQARRLIGAGGAISALGYAAAGRLLDDVLADAHAILLAAARPTQADDIIAAGVAADQVFDTITGDSPPPGVPTGLLGYDELTGGLHPGALVTLAGRPGTGKSSLALCIADHLASNGHQVLFFSLEMTQYEIAQRLISMRAGVDSSAIRNHVLRESQLPRIAQAVDDIRRGGLWIRDTPAATVTDLRTRALRFASRAGAVDAIFIDYLQLMTAGRRTENRVQEVGEISRGLKALAMEMAVPVVALSQLSRAVEGRTSHVPLLSDLRESGSIEQDSDVVAFIYREELYDRESDKKGVAELHLAKHRGGPLGVIPMRFEASTTKFMDLSSRVVDGYEGVAASTTHG